MYRAFTSTEITDETIKKMQDKYLSNLDIISSRRQMYLYSLKFQEFKEIEGEDGFIYTVDPENLNLLVCVGAKSDVKGIENFTCVADVIAPKAFAISEEDEGSDLNNDYIHILHLPYCKKLATDCFQGICHAIMVDAPGLAEERALKYLLSLMEKYKDQIDLSESISSTHTISTSPITKSKKSNKP